MTKLVWDAVGEHLYETGTRQMVLYPQSAAGAYPLGVAWNGFRTFEANPSGGDETKLYADDIKYLGLRAAEDFGGNLGAYTYPDEWAICDGSAQPVEGVTVHQQPRKAFGFCVRTVVGNDTDYEAYGYKLHLVYNATASPSSRSYETINDSPSAVEFSWEFAATPVPVSAAGLKPTSYIEIDSTKVDSTALADLEAKLYGTDNADPYLPLPDEVFSTLGYTASSNG